MEVERVPSSEYFVVCGQWLVEALLDQANNLIQDLAVVYFMFPSDHIHA